MWLLDSAHSLDITILIYFISRTTPCFLNVIKDIQGAYSVSFCFCQFQYYSNMVIPANCNVVNYIIDVRKVILSILNELKHSMSSWKIITYSQKLNKKVCWGWNQENFNNFLSMVHILAWLGYANRILTFNIPLLLWLWPLRNAHFL